MRYFGPGAKTAFCLVCLLQLCGCGDLFSTPAPLQMLALNSQRPEAPLCAERAQAQLIVNYPESQAGLGTDRMATLLDGREIQYVDGYRWEAPAPDVVQRVLAETFAQSGCFLGATTPNAGISSPYRLQTTIKRLHYLRDAEREGGTVAVHLLLTLVDMERGAVIAQHDAAESLRGDFHDARKLGEAMEKCLNKAAGDSAAWAAETLTRHIKALPSQGGGRRAF